MDSNTKNTNKLNNDLTDFLSDLTGDSFDLKPLSDGLGFKDRVSDRVSHEAPKASAYAGTLDIGKPSVGDGDVSIGSDGRINVESPIYPQPFLRHSGHDGLTKQSPKKIKGSLVACFIDLLALVSGFMFVVAFLMVFSNLELSVTRLFSSSTFVLFNYFILFSALYLSYTVLTRSLFGKTLGEWACRIQLGLRVDQEDAGYPIRVMVREMAFLFTGVIFLPLVSALISKDIGYYISGLQNYLEEK